MDALRAAVAVAVSQMKTPRHVPATELAECAAGGVAFVETVREAMVHVRFAGDVRSSTALPLLLACMDQAWAFCHLLATAPHSGQFGAITLYRSMVETVLRGAFFALPATLEEVDHFRRKDEMPKRLQSWPGKAPKMTKLSAGALAEIIDKAYAFEPRGRLVSAVRNDWEVWHGIVHGGVPTMALFGGNQCEGPWQDLGWVPENAGMKELVPQVCVFAWLAIRASLELTAPEQGNLADRATKRVWSTFQSFLLRWDPPRD